MLTREKLSSILSKKPLVIDGAFGTLLMFAGIRPEDNFDLQNVDRPDLVLGIHKKYVAAGADIIETNTFGVNRSKLEEYGIGLRQTEIINAAVGLAKQAAKGKAFVCASVGPLGKLLEPMGELAFDQAYDLFAEQAKIFQKAGADLVSIETISDLQEMRAAVLAFKENSKLPIIASMTYDENGRTISGTSPEAAAVVLEAMGVDVISANCSSGPKPLLKIAQRLVNATSLPIMIMPNAGTPDLVDDQAVYKMTPQQFASFAKQFLKLGVRIVGGCCGTTPAHIAAVKKNIRVKGQGSRVHGKVELKFASRTRVVSVKQGELLMVGEKINPTGRKALRTELRQGQTSLARELAILQTKANAHLLDINCGVGDADEKAIMKAVLSAVSVATDLPFCLDSANPAVLEYALKNFCGRPLLNSVSGKKSSLEKVFPLAKKFGTAAIGLCMDDKGVPKTAAQRLKIAKSILAQAKKIGFPKECIFIDPLVMTAGIGIEAPLETLKALKLIKSSLKVKTILGLSNVSHGLPNRPQVNALFLMLALLSGADAAIIDPSDALIEKTLKEFKKIKNKDSAYKAYLEKFKIAVSIKPAKNKKPLPVKQGKKPAYSLSYIKQAVIDGDAANAAAAVNYLLGLRLAPQKIIDQSLVPAMEKVGQWFSCGKYYLPQVLASAEAMRKGFELCKARIPKEEIKSRGKILIATVAGDVHDIGKNIVKMMLENNGFQVIDLGKDISADRIVAISKKEKPQAIALSALLTTTMPQMRVVKEALVKAGLNVPVMVGGGVVSQEYAAKIDAKYSSDAISAVELAKRIIRLV